MKTIIQLLIAGVVIVAATQAFRSAWNHYAFRDAVEQEARYGNQKTTGDLHRKVIEIGAKYGVALEYDNVQVTKQGMDTLVHVSYTESVPLVPRVYSHDWAYDVSISVFPVRPIVVDDVRK